MRFLDLKANALSDCSSLGVNLSDAAVSKSSARAISRKDQLLFCLSSLLIALSFPMQASQAAAREIYPDSHMSVEAQALLNKASRHLNSKNYNKALAEVENLSAMSLDGPGLAFAASILASKSGQANKLVRVLVNKALALDVDSESLAKLAESARQSECFDLYKATMDKLISKTTKFKELLEIATRAQRAASADIAHLALEKALKVANNQPDVLDFIGTALALGIDDIARKGMKELIDDQETATELVELSCQFEPFKDVDATRFALRKALDKASTVDEYVLIFNAAKKYGQSDIANVAKYRGRKMGLTNKLKDEQANSLDEQEKRVQEDLKRLRAQPAGF